MRGFLRWAGGKAFKLPKFQSFFPRDASERVFCELFLGSGAFFFHFKPSRAWLNDTNPALIASFKAIKNNPAELLKILKVHDESDSEEYYYKIRDEFNAFNYKDKHEHGLYCNERNKDVIVQAARFIYMNARCFNGLYRENADGGFNVGYNFYPYGTVKKIYNERNFMEISRFLNDNDIMITCRDYELSFNTMLSLEKYKESELLVVMDPPYYPINDDVKNFTGYASEGWEPRDFERLKAFVDYLDHDKIKFLLCNSWCEKIQELFGNYHVHVHGIKRYINSNTDKRGDVAEVVVTNYMTPRMMNNRPMF